MKVKIKRENKIVSIPPTNNDKSFNFFSSKPYKNHTGSWGNDKELHRLQHRQVGLIFKWIILNTIDFKFMMKSSVRSLSPCWSQLASLVHSSLRSRNPSRIRPSVIRSTINGSGFHILARSLRSASPALPIASSNSLRELQRSVSPSKSRSHGWSDSQRFPVIYKVQR